MSQAIKVVVRVRPMNTKQKQRQCNTITQVDQQNHQIRLLKPDQPNNTKSFAYDHVFNQNTTQQLVYSKTAYGLVQNVLLGYNGTIFAYGQTGCGKTHSMVGKVQDQNLQGIIPRSFGHILSSISNTKDKQFLIRCSFIEIYNQQVRDLLSNDVKAKLEVKESPEKGVFIKDLSMNAAKTHSQLMEYMNIGNKNRSVGETAMNKDSSRSHLLFMLYLESAQISDKEDKKYVASKLNLVDLAGSERLSKTGAAGDRLKEAQKINLSLSALGNVISALVDGKSQHIPYRDSKLTRLLQDSLGGNTKTVMIANCSPADYNYDQTLSTLRYASRAKFIKNKPIINQDPKDALLKQYAQQIKRLKQMLTQQNGGSLPLPNPTLSTNPNQPSLTSNPNQPSQQQIDQKLKQKQLQLSNQKQQKRLLQQKIKQLQKIHLISKDVKVDTKIIKAIERASIINKEDIMQLQNSLNSKNPNSNNKSNFSPNNNDDIQQEQKKLQKNQSLINTQQIKLKYKSIIKKLKQKVKTLELELKDINHQNYTEKEMLLEDVRGLNKQNQLLQGMLNMLMKPHQIEMVRQAAIYNQEKQEYRIPPFYIKNKQVTLPKLGSDSQSIEMIKEMQDCRRLSWSNSKEDSAHSSSQNSKPPLKANQNLTNMSPSIQKLKEFPPSYNGFGSGQEKKKFSVNDIIKDARKDTKHNLPPNQQQIGSEKKNLKKLQLQPIKKNENQL